MGKIDNIWCIIILCSTQRQAQAVLIPRDFMKSAVFVLADNSLKFLITALRMP